MKKNFTILLVCCVTLAFGQDYKIKKDILYNGKDEVAKVDGKVNLTKTDLVLKTMSDQPILTVSNGMYKSNYPTIESLYWYVFNFPQLNKEMIVEVKSSYFNTNQFIKYEFEKKGIVIHADGFHEEELSKLTDYGAKLQEDTAKITKSINFFQSNLASNKVQRDMTEPVSYGTFRDNPDVAVFQGKIDDDHYIVIGKIQYQYNEGQSISDPARTNKILIYKKLNGMVEMNGEKTNYLIAGYIDMNEMFPELFLFQTGKAHKDFKIDKATPRTQIGKNAVAYMVTNGFL